jgi:hypothetical protein
MFVLTPALILTWTRSLPPTRFCGLRLRRIPIAASQAAIVFPGEKGQRLDDFWLANNLRANPVAGNIEGAKKKILSLAEEDFWLRADLLIPART